MTPSGLFRTIGAMIVPIYLLIVAVMVASSITMVFEPLLLFTIMQTFFVFPICFVVAYFSARSYLISGSYTFLLLSNGSMTYGIGTLISGCLLLTPASPNFIVTIESLSCLMSSVFFFAGAFLTGKNSQEFKHGKRRLILANVVTLTVIVLWMVASSMEMISPFFEIGEGPAPLRQAVLTTTVVLFAFSTVLFINLYRKSKENLLYWHSLGLTLITLGLATWLFAKVVSDPLSWMGRFAQYFGFIFFFISILTSFKGQPTKTPVKETETAPSNLPRKLGAFTVLAFIEVFIVAITLDFRGTFEPPYLVPILNTIFVSVTSIIIVYMATKSFFASGLRPILLLGCGALWYGLTSLMGGWLSVLYGGSNILLTVQNTGALVSAMLHLGSGILTFKRTPSASPTHMKLRVTIGYLGGLVLILLLVVACLLNVIPPFYIAGQGSTLLRRWVLGIALTLFAISSILFIKRYLDCKTTLLYWYSLGLGLISIGLSSFYLQYAVGDLRGWLGRISQYAGSMFLLISVLASFRNHRSCKKEDSKNFIEGVMEHD